jgi:hypothetical protein
LDYALTADGCLSCYHQHNLPLLLRLLLLLLLLQVQMIAIVRDPKFKMQPKGLKGLLSRLLPPTPDWVNHMLLHDVVDADITMQHGLDVNRWAAA